jgi:solute carrier family 8 (sodium/calcium exchanger)
MSFQSSQPKYSYNDIYNYTCSQEGLLLPILNEFSWPVPVRAGLYLAGMLYCFLGIALIADVFMQAIEKITSKTRKVSSNFLIINNNVYCNNL